MPKRGGLDIRQAHHGAFRFRAAEWMTTPYSGVDSANHPTGDMRLLPVYLPYPVLITDLGVEVWATVATSTVRLGVYADDGASRPGDLLVDAGTVDTSTSGFKSIASVDTLAGPGVVWLATAYQGSAAADLTGPNEVGLNPAGTSVPVHNSTGTDGRFPRATGVTGALPSTYSHTSYTSPGGLMFFKATVQ